MAHTVPFLKSNSEESKKLLKTDIDAMSDMINLLLYCYVECNIIGGYVSALEKMEDAIRDDRWKIKIDYYKCICIYIYNNDIKSAINLLEKYDWKVIDDVDLLTVILDVNSDILSQIDLMGIAEKICELSDSPTIKLQYRTSMGINYCLLNDIENGISIIKRAVTEYEELPQENKTSAGRRHLSKSYLHLGELSGKGEYLTTAVEGIKREIKTKGQSQKGEAQLWSDLAYCLHYLGKLNESLSAYTKSINLSHSNLTLIFKSRVLLKLDKAVEARSMLSDVNITELTPANLFDFAISKCKLAILTKHSADIDEGLDLIKGVETNDPMFKDVVQTFIVQLYDLKNKSISGEKVESTLLKISRYVSLKPNLFGIGIDFNAILEDIGSRSKK